jgi:hypothetical protein
MLELRIVIIKWSFNNIQCTFGGVYYDILFYVYHIILTHNSFFLYVYFNPLYVSSNLVLIIRRINCVNTTSGLCHSVWVAVWYAGREVPS